jgi:group I intron endonuclease
VLIGSGIYEIRNELIGAAYIGSSANVRTRLRCHRNQLLLGVHKNRHLQSAWNRDGAAAFIFRQVVACSESDLIEIEQKWTDRCRDIGVRLYNLRLVAESQRGYKMSDEARARMRAAKKNISDETRSRIAEATRRYNRKHPGEFARRKSLHPSSPMKGKHLSEIHRKRLSESRKGYRPTAETRRKLSQSQLGRVAWNRGKSPSAETIEKRRSGQRAAHAKKTRLEYVEIARKGWEKRRRACSY